MRRRWLFTSVSIALGSALAAYAESPSATGGNVPATQPAIVKLDLNRATPISLPAKTTELEPAPFQTTDGRAGWVVKIPGGRPIATPAYADDLLFVGGGYGSHEFYAFNADTGKLRWKMQTGDDGPTAAVVENGYVAFNTESCTIIVADARTGKLVWQEWLGDPLMSQPAISDGKLFIAYPGGNPRGASNQAADAAQNASPQVLNNAKAPAAQNAAPAGPARGNGHRLLCADLKTGKHFWEQDITGDVISAPVVDGDQIFLTCFDGTSFCLKTADGGIVWKKQNAGTSAPIVADGQVIVTQKDTSGKQVNEGIARLDSRGEQKDRLLLAAGKAEYLRQGNTGNVGLNAKSQTAQDASVGFASAPASANLFAAGANVNVNTVVGGWAYQGSRAAYSNGQILNAQGTRLNCLRGGDGKIAWQAEASGKSINSEEQVFLPPAAGAANLYVCSTHGDLICVSQKDGAVGFMYSTNLLMSFQPALAKGNLYAGANDGTLICLKTGARDADGWTAWGGNAQHNKKN